MQRILLDFDAIIMMPSIFFIFGGNRTTGKIGCPSNGCSSSTDSTCGLVKKIFFFLGKKAL
jgi:hypothetical protein